MVRDLAMTHKRRSLAPLTTAASASALIILLAWLMLREVLTPLASTPGSLAIVSIACAAVFVISWLASARARDFAEQPNIQNGPLHSLEDAEARLGQIEGRRVPLLLPSREYLLAQMSDSIRAGCKESVLAIVELKDFEKLYRFDPAAAELALASFAHALADATAPHRIVAHVERGSFGIWLADCAADEARSELRAICYSLAREVVLPERSLVPDVAARIGLYPVDGEYPETLLTRTLISDQQIQDKAENTLPNSVAFIASSPRERYSLEQDLRHAVERQQLELHYQPVVDVKARRILGAEALLRWNHPRSGQVPPSQFVPILEDTDLIEQIGLWVLNTACSACRNWRDRGLGDLTVAVNLSARQLESSKLVDAVRHALEHHGLPPSALELELTETAAMQNADRTLKVFGALKALGVALSIDDFGTGYSSLSYLVELPFDKLKIDRQFVAGIDRKKKNRAVCRSLSALAKSLQLRVIAEGAETGPEVSQLTKIGCGVIQGYFFSPPLPAREFCAFAANPSTLSSWEVDHVCSDAA